MDEFDAMFALLALGRFMALDLGRRAGLSDRDGDADDVDIVSPLPFTLFRRRGVYL